MASPSRNNEMQLKTESSRKATLHVLFFERSFRKLLFAMVIFMILLIGAMLITLVVFSIPSITKFGFSFLTGTTWDPANDQFGAFSFVVGTLMTSILSLAFSIPFSMSVAIFLGEYFTSGTLSSVLNSALELLAGIPSIIYGIVGFFILNPFLIQLLKVFHIQYAGVGIFSAAFLLAIMIIPYSASIAREVIQLVPNDLKEAAYSLGATRYEVVTKIMIPYSMSGIFAGILLSFGRALGETMAVTMVVGNSSQLNWSVFGLGDTIASRIANEFGEAFGLHLSVLVEIGLLLMIITVFFGVLGRWIIQKTSVRD
jgi:phosphate transport system permease protein